MTTPAILAALRAVLPYATTEADNLRAMAAEDASVADEADAATHAVTAARLALADVDAGWIEWAGGECPAPGDTVDVRFRDGSVSTHRPAWVWSWRHYDYSDDVVAYRIVS